MTDPIPSKIIETSRTRLRPLKIEDSVAMYELYSDPETMKYWSNQPVFDLAGAEKLVQAAWRYLKSWGFNMKACSVNVGEFTENGRIA